MDPGTDEILGPERARLMHAMAEVVAVGGFEGADVVSVCERARVPEDRFREHFVDEEDCFMALYREYASEVVGRVTMAVAADKPEIDLACDAIESIVELFVAKPSYAWIGTIEGRWPASPGHPVYRSGVDLVLSMLERNARLAGDPQFPVAAAARAALGGPEAVVRRELLAGRGERLYEQLPGFIYCALVAFVGKDEALARAEATRARLEPEGQG